MELDALRIEEGLLVLQQDPQGVAVLGAVGVQADHFNPFAAAQCGVVELTLEVWVVGEELLRSQQKCGFGGCAALHVLGVGVPKLGHDEHLTVEDNGVSVLNDIIWVLQQRPALIAGHRERKHVPGEEHDGEETIWVRWHLAQCDLL